MAKFCPECANPIIDGNMPFCSKCGARLPLASPEIQSPVAQPTTSPQLTQPVVCKSCGNQIKTGDIFCSKCLIRVPENMRNDPSAPQSQGPTIVIPKENRSTGEWIAIVCGGIILAVIIMAVIAAFIAGMASNISSSSLSSSTPTLINSQSNSLKLGESTILEYNGFKKSVRVVNFDQKSGNVSIETKNVGDKAITVGSTVWVVDWGGVRYDSPYPWVTTDRFYPGESRSSKLDIKELTGGQEPLNGKLTFYYSLGDQKASWIIKES